MPSVRRDEPLKAGQLARPVVWVDRTRQVSSFPRCDDQVMGRVIDLERTRRFRSWGHDADGVHWLCTRMGLGLHVDPAYTRFTHQLIVRNDGWRIEGHDREFLHPMLTPGTLVCLDTWSPHAVVVDARFRARAPLLKLQIVVDRAQPLTPDEVWALCSPRLADRDIAAGIENWKGSAPRAKTA